MKKNICTGAALALVMICAPQVFAEDLANYGVVKTGVYFPTGDLDDDNYDESLTSEVVYGRYLLPNLVVEGGISYFSSEADGYLLVNKATGAYLNEASIDVVPITATLKGITLSGPFDLYVGGGVGTYFVSFELEGDAYGGHLSDDDTDVVFGLHGVIGAVYNFNDRMFAGIEGKYLLTDEVTVKTFDYNYDFNLNGLIISGQFGFRF
jgi:opacity protein-like surface antigen